MKTRLSLIAFAAVVSTSFLVFAQESKHEKMAGASLYPPGQKSNGKMARLRFQRGRKSPCLKATPPKRGLS